MKQLICEMCGSTDLIKHDGVFVCQFCGCKYSVEEAKKMMIEGPVDVSGSTIKVDNSAFVQKCLENARRAKEKTDWEEVEKYYNLVEQNDPQNIEAIFYSSYAKTVLSLPEDDIKKTKQKFEAFIKSISIIDDYYDAEKADELIPIIQVMSSDVIRMYEFIRLYSNDYTFSTKESLSKAERQFVESIENILMKDEKPYLYHIVITQCENGIHHLFRSTEENKKTANWYRKKMREANDRLAEIDPTYQAKAVPEVNNGGCYIATAVYGSYNCPQVWTLRRYRDYILAETWYGRTFIRTYYAISPILVKWFGHTEWFKKMWKGKLDRMVALLNADGVEDTPYNDKIW